MYFTLSLSTIPITYLIPDDNYPTSNAGESVSLLEMLTLFTTGYNSFLK